MASSSIKHPPCTKRLLCQGSVINYNSISIRTWSPDINCISCTIPNFSDLVNSVQYYLVCTVSGFECELNIKKRSDTYYFKLQCHLVDKMNFYVKYDEDDFSVAIPSQQTDYGYSVEAPRKVVCDLRNKYLCRNTLVVHFHHADNFFVTRSPFAAKGRLTRRDKELFSRDMLKLYEIRDSTGDFFIQVLDERFIVHKFVFEARTMVNNQTPNSLGSKQISIKGDPLVMDKVIRYMYSGVLEEIGLTDSLKMLEIAVNLDMLSLTQTLNAILLTTLSIDNAWEILEMARKLDMIDLVLEAQDCLSQYRSEEEEGETESEKVEKDSSQEKS